MRRVYSREIQGTPYVTQINIHTRMARPGVTRLYVRVLHGIEWMDSTTHDFGTHRALQDCLDGIAEILDRKGYRQVNAAYRHRS